MQVQITQTMTPEYRDMAIRLLKRQVLAESATAELFGEAIKLGPQWQDVVRQAQFAHEEADHVRICAEVLEALGADVNEILAGRGDAGEFFGVGHGGLKSWTEVIAFNLIGDRAGTAQIRAYRKNSLAAWGDQVDKILKDEAQHQGYGADQTVHICKNEDTRAEMQAVINKLLPPTVKRAFGRLSGEENRYCLDTGLKSMSTEEVQYRYFESLSPIMKAAGLSYPSFDAAGVDLGASVKKDFDLH